MTATTSTSVKRILTLDIVRGVVVMGILAMNIVVFAMIPKVPLKRSFDRSPAPAD